MKIRFHNNSIRVRLSEADISKLKDEKTVATTTVFSPYSSISFELNGWQLDSPNVTFEEGKLIIQINVDLLSNWLDNDEEGIYFEKASEFNQQVLKIAVEKDFPCKH
ncbi:MAG: hypothetical protein R2809_05540 [Flavobacteriales bacterium]